MGNCLVLHERKANQFRRTEETNFMSPNSLKVHQILSKFFGYEVSKKRSRMVQQLKAGGVVRIKLVLRKQELIEMINNGGVFVGGAVNTELLRGESRKVVAEKRRGFALKSIPEVE